MMTPLQRYGSYLKHWSKKYHNDNYRIILVHWSCSCQFLLKYLFYHTLAFMIHTNIHLRKLVDNTFVVFLKNRSSNYCHIMKA